MTDRNGQPAQQPTPHTARNCHPGPATNPAEQGAAAKALAEETRRRIEAAKHAATAAKAARQAQRR